MLGTFFALRRKNVPVAGNGPAANLPTTSPAKPSSHNKSLCYRIRAVLLQRPVKHLPDRERIRRAGSGCNRSRLVAGGSRLVHLYQPAPRIVLEEVRSIEDQVAALVVERRDRGHRGRRSRGRRVIQECQFVALVHRVGLGVGLGEHAAGVYRS